MSQSKAEAIRRSRQLEQQLITAQSDVVFLLQALLDIRSEHPHVELPDFGGRFTETTWMAVSV